MSANEIRPEMSHFRSFFIIFGRKFENLHDKNMVYLSVILYHMSYCL